MPRAEPWQAPVLQPARMKTGMTFEAEADRPRDGHVLDCQRRGGRLAVELGLKRGLAVGGGIDGPFFKAGDMGVGHCDRGLGGHILCHAVAARGHDHDLLPGETAAKLDIGRVEIEAGGGSRGGRGDEQGQEESKNPKSEIRNPKQIRNPNGN